MPKGLPELLTAAAILIPITLLLNWWFKLQMEKERKEAEELQAGLDEILAGLRKVRLSQQEMLKDVEKHGN